MLGNILVKRTIAGIAALLVVLNACRPVPVASLGKVLVFSKTAAYRHASINAGQEMFFDLAAHHGFSVDTSEDASLFSAGKLDQYEVIVFLNTTGDILDDTQQLSLQRYMEEGGSWLGIHAAADTEYDWPWYNELVGAYFNGHPSNPGLRIADMHLTVDQHPATDHLPKVWTRTDEWYNYKSIKNFETLIRLDEDSYEGGTNGAFHPISWCRSFEGGRMFYTGMGHTAETYGEPEFRQLIWGALLYLTAAE